MERTLDIGRSSLVSSGNVDLKSRVFAATVPPRFETIKDILLSIADSLRPHRNRHGGTLFSLVERTVNLSMDFLQLAEMAQSTPQMIIDDFYCMLQEVRTFIRTRNRRNPYPSSKAPVALKRARDAECRILGQRLTTIFDGLREALSTHLELENSTPTPSSQGKIIASSRLLQGAHNFTINGSQFYSAPGGSINLIVEGREHLEGQAGSSNSIRYEELELEKEIHKGGEYRLHRGRARGRAVVVKVFQGPRAKQLCSKAAEFNHNLNIVHPNVLRMTAGPNYGGSFLVFDGDSHGTVESKLALTLSDSIEETCVLGANTVIACSLGLDYLQDIGLPFSIMGPDDFVLMASQEGRIVINFDVDTTWDAATAARSDDAIHSVATNKTKKVMEVCHGLIQKTFYATCKEHYRNQRSYDDDDETLFGDDSGAVGQEDEGGLSGADSDSSEDQVVLTRRIARSQPPLRNFKGHRRELVWRSPALNSASLEEIGRTYQTSLSRFRSEITRNHRRGRFIIQTTHRCPGYKRTEIILTPDIKRSGIFSHIFPVPNEICSVCQKKVEKAEVFDCFCGLPKDAGDKLLPVVKCSRCSLWQHQRCIANTLIPNTSCRRCYQAEEIKEGLPRNSVAISTSADYSANGYPQQQGSAHYYAAPAQAVSSVHDSPYFRSMTPSLVSSHHYPRYYNQKGFNGTSSSSSQPPFSFQNQQYPTHYLPTLDQRSVPLSQTPQPQFIPTPSEIAYSYSNYHHQMVPPPHSPTVSQDSYSSTGEYPIPSYMVSSSHGSQNHRLSRLVTGRPISASSPSGERFPCEKCGKTFSRSYDRKRHHETQHQPESSTNLSVPYEIIEIPKTLIPLGTPTIPPITPASARSKGSSSSIPDFQTLSNNYLNMLNDRPINLEGMGAKKKSRKREQQRTAENVDSDSSEQSGEGHEWHDGTALGMDQAQQAKDVADFLAASPFFNTEYFENLTTSPLFPDLEEFQSPLEIPYTDLLLTASPAFPGQDLYIEDWITSPLVSVLELHQSPIEIPLSDFLRTPLFSDDAMITG